MRLGKLPPDLLARLVATIPGHDPRVSVGPRPGEDAAVIDIAGHALVVTTDPITFVSDRAAWYAVQVNANDVAAMGAIPAWLAVTLLLPARTEEQTAEKLFTELGAACEELGIALVTGHTEVTDAVNRTVVVGTMFGLADAAGAVSSGGALTGDAVLLAGSPAIEGSAILAVEAAGQLRYAGVSEATLTAAAGFLDEPGISVVRASRIIRSVTTPHALHDATEGGVATALQEVADASRAGMLLNAQMMPVLPQTREICAALGLDPLGLISSGCLVACVAPGDDERTIAALTDAGITAARVGTVTQEAAMMIESVGTARPLARFDRDEIARYFESRR
jgi:hydrogenase expression/formation protein HypE